MDAWSWTNIAGVHATVIPKASKMSPTSTAWTLVCARTARRDSSWIGASGGQQGGLWQDRETFPRSSHAHIHKGTGIPAKAVPPGLIPQGEASCAPS